MILELDIISDKRYRTTERTGGIRATKRWWYIIQRYTFCLLHCPGTHRISNTLEVPMMIIHNNEPDIVTIIMVDNAE